ncbi:MAG: Bro-N domain-containing protein [Methanobrevibacter sp.]|uniref:BRO-N domain-containing protein n=1 Tax=Methanobrevibacter sp. TaxID=66852 RepID=UPI0025DBB114|nr:Bro-N domain-containing protein [Methanobrevibacter sp.]MBR0271581.1 Bro-N domain-containing protein [Methanobrevibacter sp.]
MDNETKIKLFQNQEVRLKWDEEIEEYYFSVIDVVGILSGSKNPRKYWSVLKTRLNKEGVEVATICSQLKMPSADGKMRKTDVATAKQLFRIIQSIPSPNAEPFKQWLAQVGSERLDEIADPEIAIERAVATYREKGYSEEWITQRLRSIEIRNDLTAEWDRSGVKRGMEYAILTNEISQASFGITTGEHKRIKGLKKENLRDNMTNAELVINMLGELATTEISKTENPQGFEESKIVARDGGNIAGNALRELEERTGRKVVSSKNSKNPRLLDENLK